MRAVGPARLSFVGDGTLLCPVRNRCGDGVCERSILVQRDSSQINGLGDITTGGAIFLSVCVSRSRKKRRLLQILEGFDHDISGSLLNPGRSGSLLNVIAIMVRQYIAWNMRLDLQWAREVVALVYEGREGVEFKLH